jgi:hypothetical protein
MQRPDGDVKVEFFLNYRGPLRSTQRDPKPGSRNIAAHWQLKHEMRKAFHIQLKRQWEMTPFLIENQVPPNDSKPYHIAKLASEFTLPSWGFVPLVTGRLQLSTSVDIILQRLDNSRSSVWSGDIDNRVKSIIDALELPSENDGYEALVPSETEKPFFVLLEDDKYLNSGSVETSQLLDAPHDADMSYADLKIRVRTRPENLIWDNVGF